MPSPIPHPSKRVSTRMLGLFLDFFRGKGDEGISRCAKHQPGGLVKNGWNFSPMAGWEKKLGQVEPV